MLLHLCPACALASQSGSSIESQLSTLDEDCEDEDGDCFFPASVMRGDAQFEEASNSKGGRRRGGHGSRRADLNPRIRGQGRGHRTGLQHHRDAKAVALAAQLARERREASRPWVPIVPRASRLAHARSEVSSSAAAKQEAEFAAAACVDVHTYRALIGMQTREICTGDYDLLVRVSTESNRRVADKSTVAALDVLFCGDADEATAAPGNPCMVCLGDFAAGQRLRRLSCSGGHMFHASCIEQWLCTSASRCPVDQEPI